IIIVICECKQMMLLRKLHKLGVVVMNSQQKSFLAGNEGVYETPEAFSLNKEDEGFEFKVICRRKNRDMHATSPHLCLASAMQKDLWNQSCVPQDGICRPQVYQCKWPVSPPKGKIIQEGKNVLEKLPRAF
ncbi:hypothetical protein HAX54_023210, partial [Datura stramonium]|nr:hypothetical protein [Datura stramonium]